MRQIAEFVAVLTCALFAGAAIYIAFIEAARREERAQWIGVAAFPILGDLPQGSMRVTVRKSLAERA